MSKIDIPKKEDAKGDERYFEIRNCGSDGCGSFHTFAVTADTTDEEIHQIAIDIHTENMELQEQRYYPSMFNKRPYWRPTIKVIEKSVSYYDLDPEKHKTRIERSGRTYSYEWQTKRGGYKFTIINQYIEIGYSNGAKERRNGYVFGKELTQSQSTKQEGSDER